MWKASSFVFRHTPITASMFRHQTSRTCSSTQAVLAIRREDNSVWERRAPLAPSHVKTLVKRDGLKVIVQPSNRRAYPMQEYANAGAHIQEDISEASVVIGVKQVPIDMLEADKTYVFFSHTIKAQKDNMAMLDAILEKRIRLIDYEKLQDSKGQRVVAFGKYAGVAGMINILHGMGLRLLALGHHTPFMHIGPAHNYRNSGTAMQAIRDAGYEIALNLMPKSIGPLTFIFTGSGNVSQGAQEVFQGLPHEYIEPQHLPKVAKHGATNKVYACVIGRKDHLVRKEGGGFDAWEYKEFPERYASTFSIKVAPYASCIINGIYWDPGSPRLISIPDAKTLLQPQRAPWLPTSPGCPQIPHRLLAICDISADPGGSIEFMTECTTIDKPFCSYDAEQNLNYESFAGDGVLICSIDNMPAQIPREATDFFGSLLFPYVLEIMKSNATEPFEDFAANDVVKNAVIASNGELTPKFKYIQELRLSSSSRHKTSVSSKSDKKILVLGAGYVSAPVVDYLTRDDNVRLTVASQMKTEIDNLASQYPNTEPVLLEMHRSLDEIDKLVADNDVVLSLLPYNLHPEVAKLCLKHKRNMVTASYCTPAMMELHQDAVDAGVLIMNEVGLDPGIDHMLAMKCFDEVREHGGRVQSFVSWCGGLTAPENSDNPLRYKFSWSPLGVLKGVLARAQYLDNGKVVVIPEGELLNHTRELDILPGFNLEGFPNRDSVPYSDLYNIQGAKSIVRGTLRFKGFSHAMRGLLKLGLIDDSPHPMLHQNGPELTWRAFMCELMGKKDDILVHSLKSLIHDRLGCDDTQLAVIEDLGLLEEELIDKRDTSLNTLSNYLSKRLTFGPGERDLIIMHHEVGIQWPDYQQETRKIDFVYYGNPEKYSAMAATVGYTAGIATKMVLEGEIQGNGMMVPFDKEIYRPILKRLEQEGFKATERIIRH